MSRNRCKFWGSLYPCAEISRRRLLERFNPGDGLNFEKFARVSKNLRKFSLSEWQFIGPTTKQRNVFVLPAETTGFGPWHRDILQISDHLRQKTQSWVFSKRLRGFLTFEKTHSLSSREQKQMKTRHLPKHSHVFVANSFSSINCVTLLESRKPFESFRRDSGPA